ncbi:MAG: hypothetical protein P4L33_01495 [Capsulimonadaceae bacterium]|nr:hypothetical protein [Capsulimonadaceae bacterium]
MSDDLIEIDPQAINVESAPPSEQDKVDIIRPSQMHLVPIDARVVPVWEPVIEIVIEPSQQAAQVSRHKHLFPRSVLRAVATLTSKRTQGSTHHTVQLLWRVAGLVALFVGVLLLLLYLTGSLNEYLPEDMRMSNAQQAVRVQIARNAPDRGATSRRTFSANGFPSNSNYPAQSESAEIPGRNGPV